VTPHRRRTVTPPATLSIFSIFPILASAALCACVSTSAPSTETGIELDKPAVEISEAATANGPFLAAGPDGSVQAFWSQDNVVRRRVSMDGGLTFGPDEEVLAVGTLGNITAGQQQPQPLSAVVDDLGEAHLLVQISDPVDAGRSDIYYDHVERYAVPVAKALVMGGHDLAGVGQLVSVPYDPRTQQWEPVNRAALGSGLFCDAGTPTAADATRRWDHAATAYGGGIYVTGGENIGGLLDTVQYFDPDRGFWLDQSPLPGPRTGHALVGDGTYLYAIGGRDAGAALGSIARMDPAGGVPYLFNSDGTAISCTVPASSPWLTLGAALGVGRTHLDAVTVARASGDLEIYVIGGETFSGNPLQNVDAFRIDAGGVLTPIVGTPNLPTPRSRHRAVAVGERIYVMGGTSDGTDVLDDVLVLDLAAASPIWTSVAAMPGPRPSTMRGTSRAPASRARGTCWGRRRRL